MHPATVARNVAGLAGILPATIAGTCVGSVRGKRSGFDAALPRWLDWYLATGGVRVTATGREHLDGPRPAVFVFNHKNNWDSFVVASLVRTSFTALAKKELERDPLFGPFGRWMGLAFVDRGGSLSPAEQLRDVEDLARRGLSVVVAPEGTRSADGTLGPFKRGAFRIAMATGLPIIPVVLRNSEVLGSPDSKLMGSGHVDVAVLPPVPTDDWVLEEIAGRVEAVRNQFVQTLADWPR